MWTGQVSHKKLAISALQVMFEYLKAPEDQRSKFPTQELHIWRLHGYRPWWVEMPMTTIRGFFHHTQIGVLKSCVNGPISKIFYRLLGILNPKNIQCGLYPIICNFDPWLIHGRFGPFCQQINTAVCAGGFLLLFGNSLPRICFWRIPLRSLAQTSIILNYHCCKLPLPPVVQSPSHKKYFFG